MLDSVPIPSSVLEKARRIFSRQIAAQLMGAMCARGLEPKDVDGLLNLDNRADVTNHFILDLVAGLGGGREDTMTLVADISRVLGCDPFIQLAPDEPEAAA